MMTPLPALALLIKITVVLLAAFGVSLALRRASAGARHLVWLAALGALLALPPLAAWGPLPVRVLPERLAAASPVPAEYVRPAEPLAAGEERAAGTTAEPESVPTSDEALTSESLPAAGARRPGPGTILFGAWSVVALALLGWLGHGAYAVRRIVRRARPLEHPDWQTPLYEISDRLGLDAAPRLVRSDEVKMPFAAGVLRPTIVLPAESDGWSAERRTAVLIHELGHVRRRDLVGHTLARVACAFYWFHPLVWSAARHLRAESERACDDLALVLGARPSDYAEHLLDIVASVREHHTPSVALAMAHRKEFEGRMLAILNPELRRAAPGRLQTAALAGGLGVLALLVGAAAPAPRHEPPGMPSEPLPAPVGAESPVPAPVSVPAPVVDDASSASAAASGSVSGAGSASAGPGAAITSVLALAERGSDSDRDEDRDDEEAAPGQPDDERAALLARTLRSDSSAEVRRVAAWGLRRYARSELAVEALAAALAGDADEEVREMAAWALGHAGKSAAASDALLRALRSDQDAEVRATTVWALGSVGDHRAVDALTAVLRDPDPEVREVAAWAIGSLGPERAPAALATALADAESEVRLSAAWALFTIGDPSTVGALDAAFRRETDAEVQHGLVRALVEVGGDSTAALEQLVSSPDSEIRSMAIAALAGGHAAGPWPWPRPQPRPYP